MALKAEDLRGKLLTRGEVVAALGFSPTILDRAVEAGELPAIRTATGQRLFLVSDVRALARARAQKGLKVNSL